jgi:glutathione S-transferase
VTERFWEQRPEFITLNPAGLPPVLVEQPLAGSPIAVCGQPAVLDHLEETQTADSAAAVRSRRPG